ncbi:MAG TPA: DUF554 domain-containing protein [Erysipelothrix sp.]|nr:DUF554 domain-containing protein [Erysipelothrix sp.]
MLGTIVNTVAILMGSLIGLLFSKGINKNYEETIMIAISLVVLVIGIEGALAYENMLLVIASLVIRSIIGESLKIEKKLNGLGDFLESKFKKASNVSTAFVSSSLIYCVGALAIVGSLESGISGNHNTLFAKSMLDGISSIIFASALGVGVMFSALSVFLYQGTITLLASFLKPIFTTVLINEISAIGGILIMAIAINMMNIKKIKIGNMLPSIFIPILYYLIIGL